MQNKRKILLSYDLSLLHSIVTKLIIRINNEILHDKFPSNVKSVSGALPGLFLSVNLNIKTSAFHLFETMIKKSQNIRQSRKNNFHRNFISGNNNEIIDNKLEECSLDYSLSINDLSTYTMISNVNNKRDNNIVNNKSKNNEKDNNRTISNEMLNIFLKNLKHILSSLKSSFFSRKDGHYNNFNKINLPISLIELFRDFDTFFGILLKIIYESFNIDLQKKSILSINKNVEDNKTNGGVIDENLSKENILLAKKIEEVSKVMDSLNKEECSSKLSDHSGERSLRISKSLSDQLLIFSNIKGMIYCKKLSDSHELYDQRNDNNIHNNIHNNIYNHGRNENKNEKMKSIINSNTHAHPIITIDHDDEDEEEGKQRTAANQKIFYGQ